MQSKLTDYTLYRYRYILGYLFLIGVVAVGLYVAWMHVPGGLTQAEMDSSVKSGALSLGQLSPEAVINFPYHLLQKASLELFGVSYLSIKLPSVLLALLTAEGLHSLLRNWFKNSIAIPTTAIALTTVQFIFMAQSGTPTILFTALSVWLLLLSTLVVWRRPGAAVWQTLLFIVAGLIVYVPLGIYLLMALLTTIVFHPRIRFMVKSLPRTKLTVGLTLSFMISLPLLYAILLSPRIGLVLLGIPEIMPNIAANLSQIFNDWFNYMRPATGAMITPVYPLGVSLLMILGIYRLAKVRHTARSYLTWAWMALIIPLVIINPSLQEASFIIMVLLLARGISLLLVNWWYGLFPLNPYARVAGMIPVLVLVFGIVSSNVYRYAYTTFYSPAVASNFIKDDRLLKNELSSFSQGGSPPTVVVSESEVPFYSLIAKYSERELKISLPADEYSSSTVIITRSAHNDADLGEPTKILTTAAYEAADRFYIYNNGRQQ